MGENELKRLVAIVEEQTEEMKKMLEVLIMERSSYEDTSMLPGAEV